MGNHPNPAESESALRTLVATLGDPAATVPAEGVLALLEALPALPPPLADLVTEAGGRLLPDTHVQAIRLLHLLHRLGHHTPAVRDLWLRTLESGGWADVGSVARLLVAQPDLYAPLLDAWPHGALDLAQAGAEDLPALLAVPAVRARLHGAVASSAPRDRLAAIDLLLCAAGHPSEGDERRLAPALAAEIRALLSEQRHPDGRHERLLSTALGRLPALVAQDPSLLDLLAESALVIARLPGVTMKAVASQHPPLRAPLVAACARVWGGLPHPWPARLYEEISGLQGCVGVPGLAALLVMAATTTPPGHESQRPRLLSAALRAADPGELGPLLERDDVRALPDATLAAALTERPTSEPPPALSLAAKARLLGSTNRALRLWAARLLHRDGAGTPPAPESGAAPTTHPEPACPDSPVAPSRSPSSSSPRR